MNLLSARVKLIIHEHPELEGDQGQAGLARASRASKSVVSQWLSGKIKSMDIEYALEIEKNLGYNHIWLMTGREPVKAADGGSVAIAKRADLNAEINQHDYVNANDIAEFISTYRDASDGLRQILMKSVRSVRRRGATSGFRSAKNES